MKMERVLITGASRYDFEDDNGKNVKGVKVSILNFSDEETSENVHGVMPKFITAPIEVFSLLDKTPGYFDIDFTIKLGAKKPILTPTKFTHVAPFVVSK